MKPLIYVAGSITGNPWGCVRDALAAERLLNGLGCDAHLPQLSIFVEIIDPRAYEEWVQRGLDWVRRCDALYRITGPSAGADREVTLAHQLGLPVWFDDDDRTPEYIANFVADWNERQP